MTPSTSIPIAILVFDPAEDTACSTQVFTTRPLDPEDDTPILLFCAGHSQLPDGRILFVGGGLLPESSHNQTVIFDPDAPLCSPWSVVDDMPDVVPPGGDPGATKPDDADVIDAEFEVKDAK